LIQVIANGIWEPPFLPCKILCRHLTVSKETCARILHGNLGLEEFHLQWAPSQLAPNMKASRVTI
jgi:hypothetical protein